MFSRVSADRAQELSCISIRQDMTKCRCRLDLSVKKLVPYFEVTWAFWRDRRNWTGGLVTVHIPQLSGFWFLSQSLDRHATHIWKEPARKGKCQKIGNFTLYVLGSLDHLYIFCFAGNCHVFEAYRGQKFLRYDIF